MQRYFVNANQIDILSQTCIITGGDVHHIKNVMRMHVGDQVYLADNVNSYIAKIKELNQDSVVLNIVETLSVNPELDIEVTIAHGLVCREKREDTVQKITQLGASYYLPVQMKRSVVKIVKEKEEKQTERLQKIAKEASEQSHRIKELVVNSPILFSELLKLKDNYDACLFASTVTDIKNPSFKTILKDNNIKKILILVGPEAGIDEQEEKDLVGWIPITLGPRILRTEVAPLYIMSAISFWKEIGE